MEIIPIVDENELLSESQKIIPMKKIKFVLLLIGIVSFNANLAIDKKGKKDKKETKYKSSTFSGLKFRNIGPALTSGRIADIAVNPNNASESVFDGFKEGDTCKTRTPRFFMPHVSAARGTLRWVERVPERAPLTDQLLHYTLPSYLGYNAPA
jgi:hypothetical protein